MSINPLNDISRVYLEQVATEAFVDPEQGEAPSGRTPLQNVSDHPKASVRKKAVGAFKNQMGKEYGGTWRSRTKDPVEEAAKPDYLDFDRDGNKKETMKKALKDKKKVEEANDGNLANNYPPYDKVTRGDVIAGATGKDQMGGKKKKVKEGFSNWREDLSEVMNDTEDNKKITEKKVNNKITINPKLNEAVEEIGGTLLEMVEIDEVDFIVESVYDELLDEGYDEDSIEEAIEYALTEAKVTFGHDTSVEKKKSGLMAAAKEKLASVKKAAKQAVATGARKVAKGALGVARKMEGGDAKPSPAQTKTRTASTYRGAGVGTKEKVSSGSYTPPAKKKAEKPSDPWEGSATTPTKAKAKKAAAPKAKAPAGKGKRKSKLDALLADVRNEEAKPFPFKKVEAQKEKARKGSVYGKPATNEPAPNVSDAEKKATTRFSKMQHTYEKEKRAKQEADKARRSSTFYKDTHPASAPKMKKANEETQIDEKITAKTDMGTAIKDFYASKSPQLAGRTKEERRKAAIAAVLTARRGGRKLGEQTVDAPILNSGSMVDKKKEMLDKQKLANLKMMQQKQQMLQRQRLQMQKSGKLPLDAN